MDPFYWSAGRLVKAYAAGETDPVEVTEQMLARIAEIDPGLNSFRLVCAARARADAEAAWRRYQSGSARGPLDGVPIALKDLIDTAGIETTYGTRVLCGRIPAADASVAARLRDAGTVMLGKLHLLEFAMGSVTGNAYFGPCRNPWQREHFSGGSSTGAGVAVAAGLAYGALGTDTSGSIRQPGAWCGVAGLKPTNGSIDLTGIFPLSPTCDTVGPLARSAADAALLLDAIADRPSRVAAAARGGSLRGTRIGVPYSWVAGSVSDAVGGVFERSLAKLQELGAELVDVDLQFDEGALAQTYRAIAFYECAAAHRHWYPARAADYAPYLRGNIESGLAVTAQENAVALERRRNWQARTKLACADLAAVLTPTQPTIAPDLADDRDRIAGREVSALAVRGRFTMPWSVLGWPALSVPAGFSPSGLPVGIQLAAAAGAEAQIFAIASTYERVAGHSARHPIP